jgi:tripartite-type tricarboxylate transporter receptor subunit TctC
LLPVLFLLSSVRPALADPVADFYNGKRIILLISSGVGGGYDLYGRLVASHMDRHIPGHPSIIAQNQPGAGGIKVLNYGYNQAPRDGTMMFTLHIGLPLHQALGRGGVRYDTSKIIGIGRVAAGNSSTGVWHTLGIKSVKDVMTRPVVVGATQASSNSAVFPTVGARILGAKIKVITGYKSQEEIMLAMERGEVQGFGSEALASMQAAHANYIRDKLYTALFQWGLRREKVWADVPLASELATNETDRKALEVLSAQMDIGRSYYLPPGVPADRVAALRKAFKETVADPDFLKNAARARLEIRYATGPETEQMIANVLAAPKIALDRLKTAMKVKSAGSCEQVSSKAHCRAKKKKKKRKN